MRRRVGGDRRDILVVGVLYWSGDREAEMPGFGRRGRVENLGYNFPLWGVLPTIANAIVLLRAYILSLLRISIILINGSAITPHPLSASSSYTSRPSPDLTRHETGSREP